VVAATGVVSIISGSGDCSISATKAADSNYTSATSAPVAITITKATATITLGNLSQVYSGTAKSVTATTSPVGKTVIIVYTQDSNPVTPVDAGNYDVAVTISDANYTGSAAGTLFIDRATPVITWATPVDIHVGTPLSTTQLNAAANVPGSFDYTPPAGTQLAAGALQSLSVSFTPTDIKNYYYPTAKSVFITVATAENTYARIEGAGTYTSVQAAYIAAETVYNNDPDKKPVVIKLVAGLIDNTLIASLPIHVVLEGGYKSDYSGIVDSTTLLASSKGRVELRNGRVDFRNIRLK
jgi:hypothetical protein